MPAEYKLLYQVVFILIVSSSIILAQQSTTGPVPPPGIYMGSQAKSAEQVVMTGVPAYLWQHGCGPTAAGMVIGYWDAHGYQDLVPGDASTQTSAVNAMIAADSDEPYCGWPNSDHYQDYSCPIDNSPTMFPDRSSTGGAHTDNCVGDFMKTSQSDYGNYYGWSWNTHVPTALEDYVNMVLTEPTPMAQNIYFHGGLWEVYKAEIDNNRPVVLLVDTDGNNSTDHFVTGIGYNESTMEYGIYNTWDHGLHWLQWRQIGPGISWGIYNITTFNIALPGVASTSPVENLINVPISSEIIIEFVMDMNESSINPSTFKVIGDMNGIYDGTIYYDIFGHYVEFNPSHDFECGEEITVILTDGIECPKGTPLTGGYCFQFKAATDAAYAAFALDSTYALISDGSWNCVAADFDGNNSCDLAVGVSNTIEIYLNDGSGVFTHNNTCSTDPYTPMRTIAADLNADGSPDIIICDISYMQVRMSQGDGSFGSPVIYDNPGGIEGIIAVDIDNDGDLDLATTGGLTNEMIIFINDGTGVFSTSDIYPGNLTKDVAALDLNRDGVMDIVTAETGNDALGVFLNDGEGNLAQSGSIDVVNAPGKLHVADFDLDGYVDIAVGSYTNDTMAFYINNGEGVFVPGDKFEVSHLMGSAFGDLDGDGDLDFAFSNDSMAPGLEVFLNNGSGVFTPEPINNPGDTVKGLTLADFNGDQKLDLAVAVRDNGGWLAVHFNDRDCGDPNRDGNLNIGDAVFLNTLIFQDGPPPNPYQAGDVNCDKTVNVGDAVYMVNFVFKPGSPVPCEDCP